MVCMGPKRSEREKINWTAIVFWVCYLLALGAFAAWLFSLLTGCAGLPRKEIPEGCEDSLIYSRANPEWLSVAGLIAVSELVHQYPQAKPHLVDSIRALGRELDCAGVTYAGFAQAAARHVLHVNQAYHARLLVYTEIIHLFSDPVLIHPCDRDLIQWHLNRQLMHLGVVP